MDKYAGIYLHHNVGEKIEKGGLLITLYAESKSRLAEVVKYYKEKDIFTIA